MLRRFTSAFVLLAAAAFAAAPRAIGDPADLIVHEWGTFTSIAGPDGSAVGWAAQAGPNDLPCFVERSRANPKASAWGTVRMETPVLYFYAPHDTDVSVRVRFPQGVITEWFPRGVVDGGRIAWTGVGVRPALAPDFLVEPGPSHYYLARETDASPLVLGAARERFLFYRGVGTFAPPIAAISSGDGSIAVWNPRGRPIGDVIAFENRGGATAYDLWRDAGAQATLAMPALDAASAPPAAELERMLIAGGLYAKEARAMVDTWRDSWFEEGARLFYVVPSAAVDSILPLAIEPAPAQTVRVFVGRVELITPTTERAVAEALANDDRVTLAKYARFMEPIGKRLTEAASRSDRAALSRQLQAYYASSIAVARSCGERRES
jgi:hypothetical protein